MFTDQIELPEDKPAWEWVRGRALQKMSPSRRHSLLQRAFGSLLHDWAGPGGSVGTEWRFVITPLGGTPRSLVPDVSYIQTARLEPLSEAEREYPPLAPDIVVEILSPDDRRIDVEHKRAVYLSAGVRLVLTVDPLARTMRAESPPDQSQLLTAQETYVSPHFPGLVIALPGIFAELDSP